MSFPMGSVMTPKELMIDPNKPPAPRKSISSIFQRASSAQSKMEVEVKGGEDVISKDNKKAKGAGNMNVTVMFEWTAADYAKLANTPVGKIYDQPSFVPDAGIEKYVASRILDQYPDRFKQREGSSARQSGPKPKPTEAKGPASSDNNYEHLSSAPSEFSWAEGEEAITVQKQRLPRDSYHKILNQLATGTSSIISDLNSSAACSIPEEDTFEAFIARAQVLDAANLTMSREDSQNMNIGLIASDDSNMEHSTPSSTRALRPEDSASRPNSIHSSTRSRVTSSQSLETIPERYKLKGLTMDGKKYYVREHSATPDSLSVKTNNSFANLTIQELVQQHPQLQSELEALKKSIEEHDRDLRQVGINGQKQLKHQFDE